MNRTLIAALAAVSVSGCAGAPVMPAWVPFGGHDARPAPAPVAPVSAPALTPDPQPRLPAPAVWRRGPQPGKPTLIVTIVVDQFSATLFNQYRGRLTGGLHTLSEQGRVYQNGYQSHANTETCPGHSTLLTGANPERTGIPANDWTDRVTGQEAYCLAAPRNTLAHGRNTDNGPVGPDQLMVTTLGDWVRAASPNSRVFAVSGKDRGAINLAGHAGRAFWFTDGFGFTTYVEPGQTADERLAPIAALNTRIRARLAAGPTTWDYTSDACRALEGDYRFGDVAYHAAVPPAQVAIDVSPTLDELTLDAATELLDGQQLGRRGVVDLLGVSLSATDRVGHAYGQQGPEMCEQMHRMDAALGAFLDRLSRLPGGVLVVLTADHGGSDFPERMAMEGYPQAGRGERGQLAGLNALLRTRFHLDYDALAGGGSGLMVLGADGKPMAAGARRDRIARFSADWLKAQPRIAGAWTLNEVMATPLPPAGLSPQEYSLMQRERLSAVPGRSPDILLAYQPGITPGQARPGATIANHGSPWDYDRRVPIVFWSPGVDVGQERPLAIRTIDIAPTLANVVGVAPAATVEGRCIDLGLFAAPACPVAVTGAPPAP